MQSLHPGIRGMWRTCDYLRSLGLNFLGMKMGLMLNYHLMTEKCFQTLTHRPHLRQSFPVLHYLLLTERHYRRLIAGILTNFRNQNLESLGRLIHCSARTLTRKKLSWMSHCQMRMPQKTLDDWRQLHSWGRQ